VLDPARKQQRFAAIGSVIDGVGGRVAVTQRARRLRSMLDRHASARMLTFDEPS
jgi:hypothetical protein